MESIAQAVAGIRTRIAAACAAAGRDPAEVRLLPVSKTVGVAAIREAYAAGCARFGENKVQEAWAKAQELAELPDLSWAFLGHLQSNKARVMVRFATEFQALDSFHLAEELDRRLHEAGRQLDVLVEVNSSGEDSKFGLPPEEVPGFVRRLSACDALRVRGLMTLALPSPEQEAVAACFRRMVAVQRALREAGGLVGTFDELSMGMSQDFELAIAHGATVVRIGRAIFGERN